MAPIRLVAAHLPRAKIQKKKCCIEKALKLRYLSIDKRAKIHGYKKYTADAECICRT